MLALQGEQTNVVVAKRVERVPALFAIWTSLWREICGSRWPKFKHGSLGDVGRRAG